MNSAGAALRRLLEEPGALAVPGAFDALGARIVEAAGFPAVFMGGYTVEATYGNPDLGLLSVTEMAHRAEAIASSVSIPLIADADNGYGNALNVARTVRAFERAGVAGIMLEDQQYPKKSGSLTDDIELVTTGEFVGKIQAAVDSRTDPDFLIIARTDANRVIGLDAALERALAYEDAGADLTFVQLPRTVEEIERIAETCHKPLMITVSESALVPILPFEDYASLGMKVVVYPLTLLMASVSAMSRAAEHLRRTGRYEQPMPGLMSWPELDDGLLRTTAMRQVAASYLRAR